MIITEIRVEASRVVNLGNWENLKIAASVTASIPEGDDLAVVKAALQIELRTLMEETWRAQYKAKTEGAKDG
jgi:hypothetical protein